jgi:hypothetical protein
MAHVLVLKQNTPVLYHLFLGNLQRQQFTETVTGKIEAVLSTPFGWTVLLALSALQQYMHEFHADHATCQNRSIPVVQLTQLRKLYCKNF